MIRAARRERPGGWFRRQEYILDYILIADALDDVPSLCRSPPVRARVPPPDESSARKRPGPPPPPPVACAPARLLLLAS